MQQPNGTGGSILPVEDAAISKVLLWVFPFEPAFYPVVIQIISQPKGNTIDLWLIEKVFKIMTEVLLRGFQKALNGIPVKESKLAPRRKPPGIPEIQIPAVIGGVEPVSNISIHGQLPVIL